MYLPKFLSPLNSSNINTPICIKPSRAEKDYRTVLTTQYNYTLYVINAHIKKQNINTDNSTNSTVRIEQHNSHWSDLASFKWKSIGTKISSTSLLFST